MPRAHTALYSIMSVIVEEEEMKLEEEEEETSPAAQLASETVALDVDTDSAAERLAKERTRREADAERDAVNNHRFCALVDFILLLVQLLGMHLSEHPTVVSAPIVTMNWCNTAGCDVEVVEQSFNTGYLSVAMLSVELIEDLLCGYIVPRVYVRLARSHANYIGAVASWIVFSLLHMQAGMLTGSIEPRMFMMFPVLMGAFFLIVQMQYASQGVCARVYCAFVIFAQWMIFFGGEMLQSKVSPFVYWQPFLTALEVVYFWVLLMSRGAANEWSTKDRRLLMTSVVIRALNTLWLFIVLIAADP